jgi:hypothetical protein
VTLVVQAGDNPVRIPMMMSGPCYEVSADPGLAHGTVQTNFTLAFEGTPVTLTAAPDEGYVLKEDTFKYNDGTDHVIADSTHTFAMPAGDVTASAEFEPLYNVIVGPLTGGTVTPSAASAVEGTVITLTVQPASGHVLKAGTLTYNGNAISGSPYTFAMPASDVTVGAEFIPPVRYVRVGGAGNKDGTSWADASDDLQKMMDTLAAIPSYTPRIVKAAAGTYKPRYKPDASAVSILAAGDRDSTFILRAGVQVWGGYPASGGDDPSRNITANITALSGDIDGDNTESGNAYHVVLGVNIPASSGTVLDGLTITGGNANGSGDITVFSKQVKYNNGGGVYNINSSPVLTNVTISGNIAYVGYHNGNGGGMYNDYSSPALANVTISGNDAGNDGGGIYNDHSSPVLVNVLISGNKAYSGGSGIKNQYSDPILTNVTISGNLAGTASYMHGSIYNDHSSPQISNSIIWGNTAHSSPGIYNDNPESVPVIKYSIVQESGGSGSWAGATGSDEGNNLDMDPQFVSPLSASSSPTAGGNYRLNNGPAFNAGDNSLYPSADTIGTQIGAAFSAEIKVAINAALAKDLGGANRKNGAIDMGAYEKQ